MNKRIKELAEKAKEYADGYDDRHTPIWWSKYEEKFAELIIQDCLKIVEQRTKGPYDVAMTNATRNAWNIWIKIKEHFGVKDE